MSLLRLRRRHRQRSALRRTLVVYWVRRRCALGHLQSNMSYQCSLRWAAPSSAALPSRMKRPERCCLAIIWILPCICISHIPMFLHEAPPWALASPSPPPPPTRLKQGFLLLKPSICHLFVDLSEIYCTLYFFRSVLAMLTVLGCSISGFLSRFEPRILRPRRPLR